MEVRQIDGSEIEDLEEHHEDYHVSIYLTKGLALKVPHKTSTYERIAKKLRDNDAEFDDEIFYRAILESLAKAGIELPNPWKVERLLVDESPRTCFWQEYFRELDTGGITFQGQLPLQPNPRQIKFMYGGRYIAADFAQIGDREIFFDWDLYFLYLFEQKLQTIKEYSRSKLYEICREIENERVETTPHPKNGTGV